MSRRFRPNNIILRRARKEAKKAYKRYKKAYWVWKVDEAKDLRKTMNGDPKEAWAAAKKMCRSKTTQHVQMNESEKEEFLTG